MQSAGWQHRCHSLPDVMLFYVCVHVDSPCISDRHVADSNLAGTYSVISIELLLHNNAPPEALCSGIGYVVLWLGRTVR